MGAVVASRRLPIRINVSILNTEQSPGVLHYKNLERAQIFGGNRAVFIEQITLTNFRCFGPAGTSINLESGLTTFVGVNGAGKTAVLQALQRLFGITGEQRRLRRQDFHVPAAEPVPPLQRTLTLEAILAFPELDAGGANVG